MANFVWKGKSLETYGDIMNAMQSIETPEEAAEFMTAYRADDQHADHNVGYMLGYLDPEEAQKKMELFGVVHPIFGKMISEVTPQQALQAGIDKANAND